MPVAEIIAIGTELLLGEIQDSNTRFLARKLRDIGVDLYRVTIIGDNEERIAQAVRESLERAHIIITSGGLGPTVDDPTRQSIANAVGVELVFLPELWDQITARFQRYGRVATENNRRQAYIPEGGVPVKNPTGTAPAFYFEQSNRVIISLPGVPRELEHLMDNFVMPFLKEKYTLHGIIKACVLHTAGVGESQIDEWIGDLETNSNPSVGLLAHPGQVDVRITAKANSIQTADQMIEQTTKILHQRLGDAFFGTDEETLEGVISKELSARGWTISLLECGVGAKIAARYGSLFTHSVLVADGIWTLDKLSTKMDEQHQFLNTVLILGVSLQPTEDKQVLFLRLITPHGNQENTRSYGGPPENADLWAASMTLDFIRRNI